MRESLRAVGRGLFRYYPLKSTLLVITAFGALGCAEPINLVYQPKSFQTVDAAITTVPFTDNRQDDRDPNQIDARNFDLIRLTKNVADYVEEGVAQELRQMRISRRGNSICRLGGSVDFMKFTGKVGAVVQLETAVTFTLTDPSGTVLLSKTERTNIGFVKNRLQFMAAAVNDSISQSFQSFINDPAIAPRLEATCPRVG